VHVEVYYIGNILVMTIWAMHRIQKMAWQHHCFKKLEAAYNCTNHYKS